MISFGGEASKGLGAGDKGHSIAAAKPQAKMQPGDYRSGQSRPSMGSWANPLCFCSILDGTGVPRAGPTVAFIR